VALLAGFARRAQTGHRAENAQIADYIWYSRAIEGAGESGRGAQVSPPRNARSAMTIPRAVRRSFPV